MNKSKNKLLIITLIVSFLTILFFFRVPQALCEEEEDFSSTKHESLKTYPIKYNRFIPTTPYNENRWGLGFSSATKITGSESSLSALLQIDRMQAVQIYFALPSVKPFAFGIGGSYKYIIFGNERVGFHAGGGIGAGTMETTINFEIKSKFYASFNGIGGIHFKLKDLDNLLFQLDGGPSVVIINESTTFSINGFTPFMGLSIHYLL